MVRGMGLGVWTWTLRLYPPPAEAQFHPEEVAPCLVQGRRTPDWEVPKPLSLQTRHPIDSKDEHSPLCLEPVAPSSPALTFIKVAFGMNLDWHNCLFEKHVSLYIRT